jgi:GDPmannose 4,6-dehydratase
MKPAFIVGASGQDGTLLSGLLTQRSVPHLGLSRQGARDPSGRALGPVDLRDFAAIAELVRAYPPSHVFYLAAHHHSSQDALDTAPAGLWQTSLDVQVMGLVHFLEALRQHAPAARLFYAASSHVFGSAAPSPQTEETPLAPENVYAIAKVAGMHACRHYRTQPGLHASVGILYNHESILRQEKFLSRKIIQGALAIRAGHAHELVLGDLAAEADWGYAPDYVEAMVRILELPQPGDFIIATGQLHTVREFAGIVFRLVGDYHRLHEATGWKPSLSFEQMVRTLTRQLQAR